MSSSCGGISCCGLPEYYTKAYQAERSQQLEMNSSIAEYTPPPIKNQKKNDPKVCPRHQTGVYDEDLRNADREKW